MPQWNISEVMISLAGEIVIYLSEIIIIIGIFKISHSH